MRPAAALAFMLAAALVGTGAHAGPPTNPSAPPEAPPLDSPNGTGQAEEFVEAPVLDPWQRPGGFWLSVELIGPRGAQLDGARSLRHPPVADALPRAGAPVPGELVGRVDNLEQALRWLDAHAFSPLSATDLEIPGGELWTRHGLVLTALVLTRDAPASAGAFPWPPANVLPIPEDLGWEPASLAVARAPVFAAPAPQTLIAAERYRVASIDDAIWQLGVHDSCSGDGSRCLRWAKILVRSGDRFFGGWVPASHVVPDRAWIGGPGERRFALIASDRSGGEVGYVLLEQGPDRREAPVGLRHARVARGWPQAGVDVLSQELVVLIDDEAVMRRHLDTPSALGLP